MAGRADAPGGGDEPGARTGLAFMTGEQIFLFLLAGIAMALIIGGPVLILRRAARIQAAQDAEARAFEREMLINPGRSAASVTAAPGQAPGHTFSHALAQAPGHASGEALGETPGLGVTHAAAYAPGQAPGHAPGQALTQIPGSPGPPAPGRRTMGTAIPSFGEERVREASAAGPFPAEGPPAPVAPRYEDVPPRGAPAEAMQAEGVSIDGISTGAVSADGVSMGGVSTDGASDFVESVIKKLEAARAFKSVEGPLRCANPELVGTLISLNGGRRIGIVESGFDRNDPAIPAILRHVDGLIVAGAEGEALYVKRFQDFLSSIIAL
jgi:hypothetical protein